MTFRIMICLLWLIALSTLVGVFALPPRFWIGYHGTFLTFNKTHVILTILLLFVLPLVVLTVRHSKSTAIR